MKFVAALTLLGLASALPGQDKLPIFKVFKERSLKAIPTIEVAFPNGHEDTMILQRYFANDEERRSKKLSCNYIGRLANDPEACVAVTGCHGQDTLEMTIMSKHASPSTMFILHKNETVEALQSTFRSEGVMVDDEDGISVDSADDQNLHNYQELCASGNCDTIPATNKLQLKVNYLFLAS